MACEDAIERLVWEIDQVKRRYDNCKLAYQRASNRKEQRVRESVAEDDLDPNCINSLGCEGRGIYLCSGRYRAECLNEVVGVKYPDCSHLQKVLQALQEQYSKILNECAGQREVLPRINTEEAFDLPSLRSRLEKLKRDRDIEEEFTTKPLRRNVKKERRDCFIQGLVDQLNILGEMCRARYKRMRRDLARSEKSSKTSIGKLLILRRSFELWNG
ncbi:hypothetical protein ACFFQF_32950 [Haladaptatus pallidirubidus]|uniref:hypothetical protein n=1 Tax=Haladaptatus pallidirubidus TaxID=1008152 RepID=UPI0035E59775